MKIFHTDQLIHFVRGNSSYTFLPTGDIYQFTNGSIRLNGFTGTKKEGSVNNIWLRIYKKHEADQCQTGPSFYPLLGITSLSHISKNDNSLCFLGSIDDITYQVIFRPAADCWFWDISLEGGKGKTIDLVYGQDLGMAEQNALLENELYAAQYLDHTILENDNGYHICSRQNLPQAGRFPYIQQGMLSGRTVSFSTDGLQFFGLSYKKDQIPAALKTSLEGRKLQFESSFCALQTERFVLKDSLSITFYGYFSPDHQTATKALYPTVDLKAVYQELPSSGSPEALPPVKVHPRFGAPFTSPQWNTEKLKAFYPQRILEETEGNTLLSFFKADHTHVVTQQKELLTIRPHGNIVVTMPSDCQVDSSLITSTHYIHGLFQSQTAAGNTSRHKFLSTSRGLLNLQKNAGQRIWISIDGRYRLLSLPSVFEAGLHYSRWIYEIGDDLLQITSFAVSDETKMVTEVTSLQGRKYDFIITNQLVMGTHEFLQPFQMKESDGILHFYPEQTDNTPYPGLHYDCYLPGISYTYSDDRIFFTDNKPQNTSLLTLSLHRESSFQLIISGHLEAEEQTLYLPADFQREALRYQDYYTGFLCGFHLEMAGNMHRQIQKLNTVSHWYVHNALIHFAVPHGLEQPGGAAWGTRDVCQGPMELFLATGKFTLARNVLLHLFAHQFPDSGEWPQWFMFDGYTDHQEDCHGDVVFWPLKCVGDYIRASGDASILNEMVPYTLDQSKPASTLLSHIRFAVSSIEKRFLENTFLISYAGGDWDDTLQPASETLKNHMVSAWTQALAGQVFTVLSKALGQSNYDYALRLNALAENIRADFMKYLVIDGIPAGFVTRSPQGDFIPMLHPADTDTGIRLRLLPLTRSIIAEIADKPLAGHNLSLIEQFLHCPDGVRLMDRPAAYHGGVSRLFRRAEQAANVGREISLQYVHAHIRYLEALCSFGDADQVWESLFEINPVCLKETVPNAAYRQSNLYFSSSEGAYYDRYEYARDFDKLKNGSIPVNGGWRLYSSGPGILLHNLICSILGIRQEGSSLVIDPVLPARLDGLRFHFHCMGSAYEFIYHISNDYHGLPKVFQGGEELESTPVPGKYRFKGVRIASSQFRKDISEIHIYLM